MWLRKRWKYFLIEGFDQEKSGREKFIVRIDIRVNVVAWKLI